MKNNYFISKEKITNLRKINKKKIDNSTDFINIKCEILRSKKIHNTKNITQFNTGNTLLDARIREIENNKATITNNHFRRKKNDAK
jgi:hypothetical protein